MTRMRVHELAKELNMGNKDLIDKILRLGIQVKNHMSTLTDSAVLKIRQQFAEAKAEKVEQKRVARGVIRRRKTVSEEMASMPEVAQELVDSPGADAEVPPIAPEAAQSAEPAKTVPEAAEMPASPPVAPEPAIAQPPEEAAITPPLTVAPPAAAEITPVDVESLVPQEEREAPAPVEEVVAPPPEPEMPPAAEAQEETVQGETTQPEAETPSPDPGTAESGAEIKLSPSAVAERAEEKPEVPFVEATEEAVTAKVEDLDEAKTGKKNKKRRRKKASKDEPARIIKLPEIIAQEPEEEPELAALAPRLQVKAVEEKEDPRKKRTRPEDAAKESADRKRRAAPQRKEVVEREDLYSKKELAAQGDRGRSKQISPAVKEAPKAEPAAAKVGKRSIKIDEAITVSNLAKQMGIKANEVIKKLLLLGLTASINQALDFDTAALLASEFGFELENVGFEEEEILQSQEDRPEDLVLRPPVITVMGHVDHGKTSLLDAIRHTNVIEGEAGGITQHIGAYYVKLENGDVVFLDTPGHEAFTSMRARGAKVTDIVILVVAADDGVMQQTIEAINHAKAAEVPIIVAINKIDKPNANVDRVKRELSEHGLLPEEWGGTTTMVEISAKKRIGIDELLEMVLLQAELMELKANPNKPARGRVVESKLDKGRGPVATILIQEGTLRAGDVYVCGVNSGRVRNMFNDRGQRLDQAGPAMPVEVLGFSGVPNAGDPFIVLTDEKQAKVVAEHRLLKLREKELTRSTKVTLESLFEQIQEGEVKEIYLVLKTDVHGSQEAISDSLLKLSTPEVKVNIIHNATGAITESDIMLASASNAIIIGFNVRAEAKVMELAEQEKVDVRYYDVIYQLLSDVKDAMVGMLEPVYQEKVMGRAEVRQTFHVPKVGMIAGCFVLDGRVERGAKIRVLREQVVVYDGRVGSLKRFKDDAKEVKSGFECGIGIENFNDIKVGDILEAYELQEMKPTLTESKG